MLSNRNDDDTKIKLQTESFPLRMVDCHSLTDIRFILCVGILIKPAAIPSLGKLRKDLCPGFKVFALVHKLREIAAAGSTQDARTALSWTSVAIMEMPINIPPGFGMRLSLLRFVMSQASVWADRNNNRHALARIYMNDDMETSWKSCWEEAARVKGALNVSNYRKVSHESA